MAFSTVWVKQHPAADRFYAAQQYHSARNWNARIGGRDIGDVAGRFAHTIPMQRPSRLREAVWLSR